MSEVGELEEIPSKIVIKEKGKVKEDHEKSELERNLEKLALEFQQKIKVMGLAYQMEIRARVLFEIIPS